jgi:hypothetical protein
MSKTNQIVGASIASALGGLAAGFLIKSILDKRKKVETIPKLKQPEILTDYESMITPTLLIELPFHRSRISEDYR